MCALPAASLARRIVRRVAPKGGCPLASPAARAPGVAPFAARGRRAVGQSGGRFSRGHQPAASTLPRAHAGVGCCPATVRHESEGGVAAVQPSRQSPRRARHAVSDGPQPTLRANPRRRGGGGGGGWCLDGATVGAAGRSAATLPWLARHGHRRLGRGGNGRGRRRPPLPVAAVPAGRGVPRRQSVTARTGRAPRPSLRWTRHPCGRPRGSQLTAAPVRWV